MKKVFSLGLAGLVLLSVLVSCGSAGPKKVTAQVAKDSTVVALVIEYKDAIAENTINPLTYVVEGKDIVGVIVTDKDPLSKPEKECEGEPEEGEAPQGQPQPGHPGPGPQGAPQGEAPQGGAPQGQPQPGHPGPGPQGAPQGEAPQGQPQPGHPGPGPQGAPQGEAPQGQPQPGPQGAPQGEAPQGQPQPGEAHHGQPGGPGGSPAPAPQPKGGKYVIVLLKDATPAECCQEAAEGEEKPCCKEGEESKPCCKEGGEKPCCKEGEEKPCCKEALADSTECCGEAPECCEIQVPDIAIQQVAEISTIKGKNVKAWGKAVKADAAVPACCPRPGNHPGEAPHGQPQPGHPGPGPQGPPQGEAPQGQPQQPGHPGPAPQGESPQGQHHPAHQGHDSNPR